MESIDELMIRRTLDLAMQARQYGNHPFGSLIYDPETQQVIAEAQNTVHTDCNSTGHAELNLCSIASKKFPKQREVLLRSTLYTSTEPCAMCAGAIFWTGIGRVVFGCSVPKLNEIKSRANISADKALTTQCREVFAQGKGHEVKVTGPVIEDEAVRVHEGYWGSAEMEEQIRRMLERQKEGATE